VVIISLSQMLTPVPVFVPKVTSFPAKNFCSQRQETAPALMSINTPLTLAGCNLEENLNGSTFLQSFRESWL